LISENQDLHQLRFVSNLIKISVPVHLNFFFSLSPEFFSGLWYKSEKNPVDKLRSTEKKFRCAGPEIFLRFETDLNFSRP
jgi:hypothetical protein